MFYTCRMRNKENNHVALTRRPGRGATSNQPSRFDPYQTHDVEDDWPREAAPPLKTYVTEETPRSVITRNSSPDIPFDRSINPYRGCEHGCIYCFARPTHAYLGYSPGLDFETRLIARPKAPDQLSKELRRKSYRVAPIAIGTNTDPYQPIEKNYRVMRGILQVLWEHRHPVTITTKGTLIERDIDLLAQMARENLVHIAISMTSLDATVSRKMEPRVPSPKRRLQIIQRLSEAGIPVRVGVAPIVPALTDHELERILHESKEAGAQAAHYILLRLPGEVGPLFKDWIEEAFPDRAKRVLSRMYEMRGGAAYNSEFGKRLAGSGTFSKLLHHRFKLAAKRLELASELPELDVTAFKLPERVGDQLSLF